MPIKIIAKSNANFLPDVLEQLDRRDIDYNIVIEIPDNTDALALLRFREYFGADAYLTKDGILEID